MLIYAHAYSWLKLTERKREWFFIFRFSFCENARVAGIQEVNVGKKFGKNGLSSSIRSNYNWLLFETKGKSAETINDLKEFRIKIDSASRKHYKKTHPELVSEFY